MTKKETPLQTCELCHGVPVEINKFPNWTDQCTRCGLPVKLDRKDGQPVYVFNQSRVEEDGFVQISAPSAKPVIRMSVDPVRNPEKYQVIYEQMYHSGKLACPFCNSYLCDYGGISGSITQTCRRGLDEEKHGRKGICKTVTKFIFKNPAISPSAVIRR